jgi:hypothetical protein
MATETKPGPWPAVERNERMVNAARRGWFNAADAHAAALRRVTKADEERHACVRMMRDAGMSLTEMCELTGLSRQSVHAWLREG